MNTTKHSSRYKNIIYSMITFFVVIIGIDVYIFHRMSQLSEQQQASSLNDLAVGPTRKDFGTQLPDGFPKAITTEKGATLSQSYALDYVDQKQSTTVFHSSRTAKENYDAYVRSFKNDGWGITNHYESKNVFSLYGRKGSSEINITISTNNAKGSEVSISVLDRTTS